MTYLFDAPRFAKLFRKYRMKSEIITLQEFKDLLILEGYEYDTSLFTHWQRGKRVPKKRAVVMAILRVFCSRGGIRTIAEANEFLFDIGMRELSTKEIASLEEAILYLHAETLPQTMERFVGRERYMKDIGWDLISGKKVCIYGSTGTGKTALGIQLGNFLRKRMRDGVLWVRLDALSPNALSNQLLYQFGEELMQIPFIKPKLDEFIRLSRSRLALIILDNYDPRYKHDEVMHAIFSTQLPVLITSNKKVEGFGEIKHYHLGPFTKEEFLLYAERILGAAFVQEHTKELQKVGKNLGHLPIASALVIRQLLYQDQKSLKYLLEATEKFSLHNKNISYDKIVSKLNPNTLKILKSLVIFSGTDFDLNSVISLHSMSSLGIKRLLQELISLGYVDKSTQKRYLLNPSIQILLMQKKIDADLYDKLTKYYIDLFNNVNKYGKYTSRILYYDIQNILGLIDYWYQVEKYNKCIQICRSVSAYLFFAGYWEEIEKISDIYFKIVKKSKNDYAYVLFLIEDLGRIYYFTGKKEEAIETINESLSIIPKINNVELLGLVKQKLGILLFEDGEHDTSKNELKDSIILLKNTNNNSYLESMLYLAILYYKNNQLQKAKTIINQVLKNEIPPNINAMTRIILSAIYLSQGKKLYVLNLLKPLLSRKSSASMVIGAAMAHVIMSKAIHNNVIEAHKHRIKADRLFHRISFNRDAKSIWSDFL